MARNAKTPPSDFTAAEKRLWRAFAEQAEAQGTWKDTDAQLLELLVRALSRAAASREEADAKPFVTGSTGQLVAHPARKVQRESEQDAAAYMKALLLTPQARLQAGLAAEPPEDDDDDALDELTS